MADLRANADKFRAILRVTNNELDRISRDRFYLPRAKTST